MKLILARLLIGAAVLLSASMGASSAAPAVVAQSTPTAAPLLPHLDIVAMVTPTVAPAAPEPTPTAAPLTPYEVFEQALARSSWPLAMYPTVEARVACENTTYTPELTRHEENGTVSTGLLMVNSVHEDLAREFDLTDPLANLNAGKIVADRHARAGLPSPWMYCDARAAR